MNLVKGVFGIQDAPAAPDYTGAANAMSGTIGDMAGIYGYFQNQNPMSAYAGSANAPKTSPFPQARPW